ncbi:zinc finger, CCHC-type containing protein [Tanacetum coccineum]
MDTMAENVITAGAGNRPHMLEKGMYDSWKPRIWLYIKRRENGWCHSVLNCLMDVKTSFLNGELDKEAPKQWHQKFNEVILSSGYLLNQAKKCAYSKFDESGKGVIICLYVDDMLIFSTNQVQVDLAKELLSSRFSMKDMGEVDVILGIKINYESNVIPISQSHYIEKVLKKFSYLDCTPVSTPMDTSEKLRPNNGQALSSRGAISWASKKQTCITSSIMKFKFVALASASNEAECATTLAKAYSQMYNWKSRHLGVRHSMIRELIMNGVTFIEFVRSQQNLVDHLTKGLARDLVLKSA